eukprot:jgi/Orpsp1_1/1183232/evm.model.c7180000084354.1
MNYGKLFIILACLLIKICNSLTCEEVENIFGIEFNENCCSLQPITCDDSNEEILSIDILSFNKIDSDIYYNNDEGKLFSRSPLGGGFLGFKAGQKLKEKIKGNSTETSGSTLPLSYNLKNYLYYITFIVLAWLL